MEKRETTLTVKGQIDQVATVLTAAGISSDDLQGAEVIQSGGITKWVDLRSFMEKAHAGDREAVKGNGQAFAGALLSREEIPVDEDESGEIKADGTKVRFYYLLRLISPCPVAYKDENKEEIKEVAQPGDIVAIGERNKLKPLRALCEDGGLYVIVIKPHSRIKIGGGQTMWTFDLLKKTVRLPAKVQLLAPEKAPF
jgi:hypothetical protein